MKFVLFYHSLASDWNHGNAHFLRGITAELGARGHDVEVYEPRDGWSAGCLAREHGVAALGALERRYPWLTSTRYLLDELDLDRVLGDADVVIVHEWNSPELVAAVNAHRRRTRSPYLLFFHDTHHRAASAPDELERLCVDAFDCALVFGASLADLYARRDWFRQVRVWHEAADTRIFVTAAPGGQAERDLIFVGNWGDGERTSELRHFLLEPAYSLGLTGSIHGVRYPADAQAELGRAGLEYHGWLPNHRVPQAFHRHRFTVHVPRRYYADLLPGIPTIRVFEALAAGIPLISAPWADSERLFEPGRDFLLVRNGRQMREAMRALRSDAGLRDALVTRGRRTIESRHTCAHRVDELLAICAEINLGEPLAALRHA